MKLKFGGTIVSIALLSLLLGCKATLSNNGTVTLKGTLKGFSNAIEIEDFSEFGYILPPSAEKIIVPGKNGKFDIKLRVTSPNYYRLGRNILYLSPGDSMTVFINYDDPQDAVFNGTGANANIFLKGTPFPKMGSYLNGNYDVLGKIAHKADTIEQLANIRKNKLMTVAGVSAEFKRLETARIKADVINSLEFITWPANTDSDRMINDKKYLQSKINKLSAGFIDASLMKLVVYRDIASNLVKKNTIVKPNDVKPIKDWYTISDLVDSMRQTSDKQQLSLFKNKIAAVKTAPYRNAAAGVLAKLLLFGKGDNATDFEAVGINGKNVKLSSLKGKVIYVDLWATWCGPCMDEMPSLKTIKEKYRNNPNVAIVSLSIDNEDIGWKKAVQQHGFDGYQWRINRTKLQAYNVVTIPRMLLIDKKFKIVSMSAPLPSDNSLSNEIDKQLGQ